MSKKSKVRKTNSGSSSQGDSKQSFSYQQQCPNCGSRIDWVDDVGTCTNTRGLDCSETFEPILVTDK